MKATRPAQLQIAKGRDAAAFHTFFRPSPRAGHGCDQRCRHVLCGPLPEPRIGIAAMISYRASGRCFFRPGSSASSRDVPQGVPVTGLESNPRRSNTKVVPKTLASSQVLKACRLRVNATRLWSLARRNSLTYCLLSSRHKKRGRTKGRCMIDP